MRPPAPSGVRATAEALARTIAAWAEGRRWEWRLPLLLWLAYIGVRHLADPDYTSLFGGINLGIHEAGHIVLSFAGQWVMVAGGTLFQVAAPIAAAALLLRQPDWFAIPVCGAWLGDSLYGVAAYMADARALALPLVTVGAEGGDVEHDWSYLLSSVGLLQWDTALAALVRVAAFATLWGSLGAGAWMCWLMHARGTAARR